MVLDLLSLAISTPTAAGFSTGLSVATSEAVQQQERPAEDIQEHIRDFYLESFCESRSRKRDKVHGTIVVLKDNKLWLAPRNPRTQEPLPLIGESKPRHPLTGFFLDHVGDRPNVDAMFERLNRPVKTKGMVSTIARNRPTLNWIYVDRRTMEVKYGDREQAKGHILGPFACTDDGVGITLDGWEGFVAVEERKDLFSIYFDRDDNSLRDVVVRTRVLQCSLERRSAHVNTGDNKRDMAEARQPV